MKDHTELTRGYNKNDASGNLVSSGTAYYNFFRNPDFDNRVINGGGLYVANDDDAVVKVEGYVTIDNNKQKNGSGTIPCNVYLPDFFKYIEIFSIIIIFYLFSFFSSSLLLFFLVSSSILLIFSAICFTFYYLFLSFLHFVLVV